LRLGAWIGIVSRMRRILPVCLLLLTGALGVVAGPRAATPGEVAVGETLPEATLRGLNGPPRQLADFLGRPLIINVWASWCGPCRAEMASLERLAWLDDSDFSIVGISTDDDPGQAKAFLAHANATISHFIDSRLELENMLGASRLPLTVLVGRDGRVLRKVYGAREWDSPDALALIRETFAGAAP
jgi:thiol-disulfide isomerase/thioredoxin